MVGKKGLHFSGIEQYVKIYSGNENETLVSYDNKTYPLLTLTKLARKTLPIGELTPVINNLCHYYKKCSIVVIYHRLHWIHNYIFTCTYTLIHKKSALTGHGIYFPLALQGSIHVDYMSCTRVQDVKLRDQWCQYLLLKYICNKMCHLGLLQRPLGKVAHATMKQNLIKASRPENVQCVTLSQLISSSKFIANYDHHFNEYHDNCPIIPADFKYIKCTYIL